MRRRARAHAAAASSWCARPIFEDTLRIRCAVLRTTPVGDYAHCAGFEIVYIACGLN